MIYGRHLEHGFRSRFLISRAHSNRSYACIPKIMGFWPGLRSLVARTGQSISWTRATGCERSACQASSQWSKDKQPLLWQNDSSKASQVPRILWTIIQTIGRNCVDRRGYFEGASRVLIARKDILLVVAAAVFWSLIPFCTKSMPTWKYSLPPKPPKQNHRSGVWRYCGSIPNPLSVGRSAWDELTRDEALFLPLGVQRHPAEKAINYNSFLTNYIPDECHPYIPWRSYTI